MSDIDMTMKSRCVEYVRARIAEYITIPIVARRQIFAVDHVVMGVDCADKNPGFNIVMLDEVFAEVVQEFAPFSFICVSSEVWGLASCIACETFFQEMPEFEGNIGISWVWTDGRWHANDRIVLNFDCETDAILARMALKLPCS